MPDESLHGKTVVVTGATAGIGLHSLIAIARAGAFVIGIGRNEERNKKAQDFVLQACPDAQVTYLLADLALQSQVRRLAGDIHTELKNRSIPALDVLVNNAGGYYQKLTRTAEGIEMTLAVNHLAVFLLTHELLPLLKTAREARVITVSSGSHFWGRMNPARLNKPFIYVGLLAYARSKLANILFTCELNRRMQGTSIHAYAVDPGLVNTDIALKQSGALSRMVWKRRSKQGDPPEVPADTVLFLSREPSVQESHEVYWHDCQPKPPSPEALQEDLAHQLWDVSCALCQITR